MSTIDGKGVSDSALRIFIAAARAGTFTAAAAQLGIGQPAASHAIARLEGSLDVRLFSRSPKGASLTAAGVALHERVGPLFDEIDRAVAAAGRRDRGGAVTISVSTSLATFWLMPRLPAFKRAHPDIQLRIITTDSDRAVGTDDADLWIPLGVVDREDLVATEFCHEEIVPVADPAIAERFTSHEPRALLDAPLLELEERYASRLNWAGWFAYHGLDPPQRRPTYTSNDYSLVLQAALDGAGVALGWHHIVSDLIAAGRLMACGPAVLTDRPFPILQRRRESNTGDVGTVRDWLSGLGSRP